MPSNPPSRRSAPRTHHGGHPRAPEFDLLDSRERLVEFCRRLEESAILAIDTEFIGENTYVPILELIQVSGEGGPIGLIDVPAVGDLAPLAKLLLDPKRLKLFHSAKQDVFLLNLHLGGPPTPMFDTQIAAAMVGIGAQVSYVNLVRMFLHVHLKGAETVSDWSRRPLNPEQCVYAAQDVEYLPGIYRELEARLRQHGRFEWFQEEQDRRIETYITGDDTPDDERYRTVRDWMRLGRSELAILRELTKWRESEARKRNVPRRQVITDEALVAITRSGPDTRDQLLNLRRVAQGQIIRYVDELLEVVLRAKRIPPDQWPEVSRSTRPDIPEGLVELFQAIVRATADQESIAPNLLATREELETLAIRRHSVDTLDLPVLRGWRRRMIGENLLSLLDGRKHLRLENGNRVVIDEG